MVPRNPGPASLLHPPTKAAALPAAIEVICTNPRAGSGETVQAGGATTGDGGVCAATQGTRTKAKASVAVLMAIVDDMVVPDTQRAK